MLVSRQPPYPLRQLPTGSAPSRPRSPDSLDAPRRGLPDARSHALAYAPATRAVRRRIGVGCRCRKLRAQGCRPCGAAHAGAAHAGAAHAGAAHAGTAHAGPPSAVGWCRIAGRSDNWRCPRTGEPVLRRAAGRCGISSLCGGLAKLLCIQLIGDMVAWIIAVSCRSTVAVAHRSPRARLLVR